MPENRARYTGHIPSLIHPPSNERDREIKLRSLMHNLGKDMVRFDEPPRSDLIDVADALLKYPRSVETYWDMWEIFTAGAIKGYVDTALSTNSLTYRFKDNWRLRSSDAVLLGIRTGAALANLDPQTAKNELLHFDTKSTGPIRGVTEAASVLVKAASYQPVERVEEACEKLMGGKYNYLDKVIPTVLLNGPQTMRAIAKYVQNSNVPDEEKELDIAISLTEITLQDLSRSDEVTSDTTRISQMLNMDLPPGIWSLTPDGRTRLADFYRAMHKRK